MKTVLIGKCLLPDLLRYKYMTATDLSDKTGISVNQLSRYINNKSTMSLQTAILISWSMGCHIEQLYEWEIKKG